MNLKILKETPPWEWPEDAGNMFLEIIEDGQADDPDRILAAELAGDFTVINDELVDALLAVLQRDDEPEILKAMAGLLDYLGYRPDLASRGKEGLEKYMQNRPEAVLMDINMPEMDGVACIEEIFNYDPAANIAIISGYEEEGIDGLSEAVRKRIKDYRAKPLGLTDLSELLAAMLKEQ